MRKFEDVLGMSRRNLEFIEKLNPRDRVRLVDDKLATKIALEDAGLPVPGTIAAPKDRIDLLHLHWDELDGFALKPNRGRGGIGILIITEREGDHWRGPNGQRYSQAHLKLHTVNILDGYYSRRRTPDTAIIETLIEPSPDFRGFLGEGLPDIRVIVHHNEPVMSFTRMPTRESKGKANMRLGAVGVGIELETGVTSYAYHKGDPVSIHPDTGEKVAGLKVPFWDKILDMSVACQEITKVGYLGVDVVLDTLRGPLILELNGHPGLGIQVANKRGLRSVLTA